MYPELVSGIARVAHERLLSILTECGTEKTTGTCLFASYLVCYFAKNKETCQLQAVKSDIHDYYACASDKFKRYVALVHKDKNIIAYRSYTSYQVEPTQAEERAIIKALVDYPFDSIAR